MMWMVSSYGPRVVVARILCAVVPGERERRDGYIFAAGARVATPVRRRVGV